MSFEFRVTLKKTSGLSRVKPNRNSNALSHEALHNQFYFFTLVNNILFKIRHTVLKIPVPKPGVPKSGADWRDISPQ